MVGITEQSTTRRFCTPRTRSRESTTSSSSGPHRTGADGVVAAAAVFETRVDDVLVLLYVGPAEILKSAGVDVCRG
jgi:hypothetical protein